MNRRSTSRITRAVFASGVALALLAGAATAGAQDREGRWELTLGTFYQLGTSVDGEQGSTLDTDDDFGFAFGGGYNFTDQLAASFALQWAGIGYDASVVDDEGDVSGISGSYDTWAVALNGVYHFGNGQLSPYVGAGIGWTWIDTNIPTGPPVGGCWWDPWWGYVCYSDYPTKSTDAFSYQATVGLRYTFDNDMTFMRFFYTSQWQDFSSVTSTPRFDVLGLDVGWMF